MKLLNATYLLALTILPVFYAVTGVRAFEHKQAYWMEDDPDYSYYVSGVNLACGRRPGYNDHPGMGLKYLVAGVLRVAHPLASEWELRLSALKHSETFMRIINIVLIALFSLLTWCTAILVLRATRDLKLALLSQLGPLYFVQHFVYFSQKIAAEFMLLALAQGLSLLCIAMLADEHCERHAARYALLSALVCAYAISTKVNFAPLLIIPFFTIPRVRWKGLYIVPVCAFATIFLLPVPLDNLRELFFLALSSGAHARGEMTLLPPTLLPALKRFVAEEVMYFAVLAVAAICGLAGVICAVLTKQKRIMSTSIMLIGVCVGASLQIVGVAKNEYNYYMMPAFGMCGLLIAMSGIVLKEVTSAARMLQATLVNAFALLVLAGGLRGFMRSTGRMRPDRIECYAALSAVHRAILTNEHYDAIVMRGGFFNTSHPIALMAGDIHHQPVMQNARVIEMLYPRVFSCAWPFNRPDRCLRGGKWWTLGAVLTYHTNVLFVTTTNQLYELSTNQLELQQIVCGNYGIYRIKPSHVTAVAVARANDAESNMRCDRILFGTTARPLLIGINVTGAYARVSLCAPVAGEYNLYIRYASRRAHYMDLLVNRVAYTGIKVAATGGNSVKHAKLVMIPQIAMHAGTNVVLLRGRGSLPQIEEIFIQR